MANRAGEMSKYLVPKGKILKSPLSWNEGDQLKLGMETNRCRMMSTTIN
jgi:hypothetical protein